MGLLDDAIREHLELKRRRGAASTEVARQEQEAFGPPRRGDLSVAGHHEEIEPRLDEPAAFAAEPPGLQAVEEPAWESTESEHVPPAAEAPTQIVPPVAEPQPPSSLESAALVAPDDAPAVFAEEPVEERELELEAAAPEPSLADEAAQPTREFDAQELRAAITPAAPTPPPEEDPVSAPDPGPEPVREERPRRDASPPPSDTEPEDEDDPDVLEETPEFLQETPDHDRLWFEQRPPRDFDF